MPAYSRIHAVIEVVVAFLVGAGDDDIVAAAKEMGTEHLGKGGVVELAVQDGLDLGIAREIAFPTTMSASSLGRFSGRKPEVMTISLDARKPLIEESRAVPSGDDPALFPHGRRDGSHGGSANTDEVNPSCGSRHFSKHPCDSVSTSSAPRHRWRPLRGSAAAGLDNLVKSCIDILGHARGVATDVKKGPPLKPVKELPGCFEHPVLSINF